MSNQLGNQSEDADRVYRRTATVDSPTAPDNSINGPIPNSYANWPNILDDPTVDADSPNCSDDSMYQVNPVSDPSSPNGPDNPGDWDVDLKNSIDTKNSNNPIVKRWRPIVLRKRRTSTIDNPIAPVNPINGPAPSRYASWPNVLDNPTDDADNPNCSNDCMYLISPVNDPSCPNGPDNPGDWDVDLKNSNDMKNLCSPNESLRDPRLAICSISGIADLSLNENMNSGWRRPLFATQPFERNCLRRVERVIPLPVSNSQPDTDVAEP